MMRLVDICSSLARTRLNAADSAAREIQKSRTQALFALIDHLEVCSRALPIACLSRAKLRASTLRVVLLLACVQRHKEELQIETYEVLPYGTNCNNKRDEKYIVSF